MKNKIWKYGLMSLVFSLILTGVTIALGKGPTSPDGTETLGQGRNGLMNLVSPIFASGSLQLDGTHFLTEEGGISAYVNLGVPIDLEQARDLLIGISSEGEDYIIGVEELPGLPEEEWPLLYIHRDGWLVPYYTKFAPASRIMAWNNYDGGGISTTTLEDAIAKIVPLIGVNYQAIKENIQFYHFQYADATSMVLAADRIDQQGTDSFNFYIPFNVSLHEGSWSHYSFDSWSSNTGIDAVQLSNFEPCNECSQSRVGFYEASAVLAGVNHAITIFHQESSGITGHAGVAVVLIYSPL